MNRKNLQSLARMRLAEARVLSEAGYPAGAYYLAGYAIECGLKACIARKTRRHDFPDKRTVDSSHTHNLKELVRIAGLEASRVEEARTNPRFRNSWDIVQQWSEQSRYTAVDLAKSKALVAAIGTPKHGVMTWIKRHW